MTQNLPFTNRLAHETSPYLRQHQHNPVDWYPWGPEALERARQLDRPIFLSIGYSACHWCHVMEHESFENEEIARLLNDHFVSIKVDREERPDLDQIYMVSVQLLTGQGGWPMSVFLTPDLKPFTGGTYFPPEDRFGRPGFKRLLQAVIEAWNSQREEITRVSGDLTDALQRIGRLEAGAGELNASLLQQAGGSLARAFEPSYGGFGSAPKFPHPMDLRLLLRIAQRFGDEHALHMVRYTLDHMARGGIYDHLGGGFARYSTDARWLVPHFEKMLYDNALLSITYLETYQATGDPFYREIVQETLDWVLREMTSPQGPFYSTLDADSEGVEGKFYVWTRAEIEQILGPDEAKLFCEVYGVEEQGNWADPHEQHLAGRQPKNILHRVKTFSQYARLNQLSEEELRQRIDRARKKLYEVRSQRVWPGRDDKVLTSWNALMIDALARAGSVFEEPRYTEAACRAAAFVLERMRTPEGRLLRTWSEGGEAKLNGYLEDYSFLLDALLSVYQATFSPRWVESAVALAEVMIEQFWDSQEGGFFYTGKDHETLIARGKDPHDGAIPSGNSMAVTGLLRLFRCTGRDEFQKKAEATLRLYRTLLSSHPSATGQMLLALDFFLGPVDEVVVVGDPRNEETRQVLQTIRGAFRPNQVVILKSPDLESEAETLIPLLAGKPAGEQVTTYICRDFTCQAPLVGAEAVKNQHLSA